MNFNLDPVIGRIAIDAKDARQGFVAENHGRDNTAAGVGVAADRHPQRGELPGITAGAVATPDGFVGVFDRFLAIKINQLVEQWRPGVGISVKVVEQNAHGKVEAPGNFSRRMPVHIMFDRRLCQRRY